VAQGVELLRSWGLSVEIGAHAFDTWGHYLAGRDLDRAADLAATSMPISAPSRSRRWSRSRRIGR
jgi:hypothetical protein